MMYEEKYLVCFKYKIREDKTYLYFSTYEKAIQEIQKKLQEDIIKKRLQYIYYAGKQCNYYND